jgi:hypothetical protein
MSLRTFFPRLRLVLALPVLACVTSCGSSSAPPSPPLATTERYVGTVEGSNALVGLAVTDGKALLFFCGAGSTLTTSTHWLRGSVTLGQSFQLTDGVATATGASTGSSTPQQISGTYTESASGKPLSWSASLVTGDSLAGVYDDQLSEGLVSLIVLQPSSKDAPVAQGAFHVTVGVVAVLEVTPLSPLAQTAKGIEVDVVVSDTKESVFVVPAVGD